MYVELYRGGIAYSLSQIPRYLKICKYRRYLSAGICAGICQIPVLPKYRRDLAFWQTFYMLLTTYVHAQWTDGQSGSDDNPVPVLDRNPTVPATEALALDGRVP